MNHTICLKNMSLSCTNIYFANRALGHLGKTIQSGRKKTEREASPYDFFTKHGLRIEVKTVDGEPIPDELMALLTLQVENPPPPALGHGKYQKSGLIPVEITLKRDRDKARRELKKRQTVIATVEAEAASSSSERETVVMVQ